MIEHIARRRFFCIKNLAIISHVFFATTWDFHVDFFLNGLFGQGPQLLIPGGVFKRFIPTLGKTSQLWGRHSRLQLAGWLTPQQKASGPQLSGRTALCSAGRSSGWRFYDPKKVNQWDDSANRHYVIFMQIPGRFDLFGKLSVKSCTM